MGLIAADAVSGWRVALRLGRVSNLPTVWSNVIAATAIAGGAPWRLTVLVAAAASLLYVAGMFLNDVFDREIDARERPERPIPSGQVAPGVVFGAGFAMLAVGVLLLAGINLQAGVAGLVLAAAIVVYDWQHKRNPAAPLIMALCRALVYVVAAAAALATVSIEVALSALVIGAYVMGLTFTARLEASDRIERFWPVTLLALPVLYALPQIGMSWPAALALTTLVAFCYAVTRILLDRARHWVPRMIALLIAGIAINDALLAAAAGADTAVLLCLACFVLTLVAQRYVPGT